MNISGSKKKLLCFAHRGEAESFLRHFHFKNKQFVFDGFFESEHYFLLLTGEGIQSSTEKLSSILATLHQQVSEIINLGVAGGLAEDIQVHQICSVRTCYLSVQNNPQMKSFELSYIKNKTIPTFDCITADQRILTPAQGEKLKPFAQIVDRELWGIASVTKLYKLPLISYKIISDNPSANHTGVALCDFVKEAANQLSSLLLQFFINLNMREQVPTTSIQDNNLRAFQNPKLHFTESLRVQYETFLNRYCQLHNVTEEEVLSLTEVQEILRQKTLPKERVRLILNFLRLSLNPLQSKIESQINTLTTLLKKQDIQPHIIDSMEKDLIHLQIQIKDVQDYRRKIKALESFPIEKLADIQNGKIDV